MAEQNDDSKQNREGKADGKGDPRGQNSDKTTNVRHQDTQKVVAELKVLAQDDKNRGFEIGDLVETATTVCELRVADLVKEVGLSRQRLCDCRMTAVNFTGKSRSKEIPFHFFTLAARAAKKFATTPEKALDTVKKGGFQSTREVSKHFSELGRQNDNGKALEKAGLLIAKNGELLDRCHQADFRDVVIRLSAESIKLVVADPSYDGKRKSTTSATMRGIDGDTAAEAQAAIEDLLKLLADKMVKGGALALFRPGAALDPAWLSAAIETHGWMCCNVLTWDKKKVKLGRTDAPYGIASERVHIFCRNGDKLVAHNSSSHDDVLEFKPIQPHRTDAEQHHQHEKPLEIMKLLIGKHTHEGELVVEPFGGSAPASRAAIEMNRHWLCCETSKENLDMALVRIDAAVDAKHKAAG